jgi:integrase
MGRPKLATPNVRVVEIPGRDILYLAWTEGGKRKIESTGSRIRAQAERARDRRQAAFVSPAEGDTVGVLIDKWLKARRHKPSHKKMEWFGKEAKRHFGNLLPSEVSEAVVADYIQKNAKTPTKARLTLEIVAFATKLKIEKPAKRPPRDRYMSHAEANYLLLHCKQPHLRIFVLLALATGARHRAILGLTWDRVDFAKGMIDFRDPDIPETKKRRPVSPLSKGMLAELKAWRPKTRTHVIEWDRKPLKDIGHAFRKAAREAKMPWVTPHVLKHTAVSRAAEKGFSVDTIADLTATSRSIIRRIYRKVNPESLRDLAEALDDYTTRVAETGQNTPKAQE